MDSNTPIFNGVNSGLQVAVNNGVINHGSELFHLLQQHVPIIEEALYDSHANEHEDFCLDQTRTELLAQVNEWATLPDSKCILWLNGMAGTGKSTIARTVARSFKDSGLLGATYLFKRGEGDRGKARYLISSITRQLVILFRQLAPSVVKVIQEDPRVPSKALHEQFDKLLYHPLMNLELETGQPTTAVIVIDALDECDREEDMREIIRLFSKLTEVGSLNLRVFLTSRPEFPIRFGFRDNDRHQDLILHDLPAPVIRDDIHLFLRIKLAEIQNERSLPSDWPGDSVIGQLVDMAVPLFIFAATLYRFVKAGRHPGQRLEQFLSVPNDSATQMDKIYLPVLNQLLAGDESDDATLEEFKEIVGAIILLTTPLSIRTLGLLLKTPPDQKYEVLDPLHSVLNMPSTRNAPVRILHLSFHDYLLSPTCPFHVDENYTHSKIVFRCLKVMDSRLKRNICNLASYGAQLKDVDSRDINYHAPPVLQYSCCFWVYHIQKSAGSFTAFESVSYFLKTHFLHWLEVMALNAKISDALEMIQNLQMVVGIPANNGLDDDISEFLHDSTRFIRHISHVAAIAPLQIYYSGLVFAPSESIIRRNFSHEIVKVLRLPPVMERIWSPTLQTLKGHSGYVLSVAFSPDGQTLASGSCDKTIKLWNPANGTEKETLKDHSEIIHSVSFSGNGCILASGPYEAKLWDTTTGLELHTLGSITGSLYSASSVVLSPDGKTLAALKRDTIQIWDIASLKVRRTINVYSGGVKSVTFSPDGHTLASSSLSRSVTLWDIRTGVELKTFTDLVYGDNLVVFSPDGCKLASASRLACRIVIVWDLQRKSRWVLHGHSNTIGGIAFSPDGSKLASGSSDHTIKVWNMANGTEQQTLKGHSNSICSVAFSPDGRTLASGSEDHTIKLWIMVSSSEDALGSRSDMINSLAFSPDGNTLATISAGGHVKLWDTSTGIERQTLKGDFDKIDSLSFSPRAAYWQPAFWIIQ